MPSISEQNELDQEEQNNTRNSTNES